MIWYVQELVRGPFREAWCPDIPEVVAAGGRCQLELAGDLHERAGDDPGQGGVVQVGLAERELRVDQVVARERRGRAGDEVPPGADPRGRGDEHPQGFLVAVSREESLLL